MAYRILAVSCLKLLPGDSHGSPSCPFHPLMHFVVITDEISMELCKYQQAQCRLMNKKITHMALSTDKARVLGFSLQSTAISLPDNQALWLLPVVLA